MLTQYKNIEKIKNSPGAISATRFPETVLNVLEKTPKRIVFNNDVAGGSDQTYIDPSFLDLLNGGSTATVESLVEMHVYAGDSWITGNHRVSTKKGDRLTWEDPETKQTYNLSAAPIEIDLYQQFDDLNLTRGEYTIAFNFFKNLIGSYDQPYLKVDEISPDRMEARLRLIDTRNADALGQITNYIDTVDHYVGQGTKYQTYLLNFSRNQTALFVNSIVIGEYVYVKFQDALPDDIEENFTCWIVEEQKPTYVDRVSILPSSEQGVDVNRLSGPNWDAHDAYSTSTETGLRNWNEILAANAATSQQIVDMVFSGSLSGVDLNVDYTDFNNFVFYGSATERVKNFHYKMELLEYYDSQLSSLNTISGSVASANIVEYESKKTALIGGFDNFEKFLYYESSSRPFTNQVPVIDANVARVSGSYIEPWPKTTSTKPYVNDTVANSQTWYENTIQYATEYDRQNVNALPYAIPEYIRSQSENESLDVFLAMLGQHFDILYTYINSMRRIHSRDEHPSYGVPNELLYSVAKQFGWSLTDGNQYKELWEYLLGVNEAGSPITGSNSVGEASVPGREMTFHTWRRIVNNLPGMLKSKGTKRSVRALLACYGVPESMITIKEYGGPRIDRAPVYEKLNFDYALDLIENTTGTVTVDYDQPINAVELRFRTDDVLTNPSIPSTMNLFSVDSNDVTIDFTRGTLGTIQINETASADIEMFDGGWLNVLLRSGSNGSLEVVAKKSKYGKIVAAVSASATASFNSTGTVILGGTSGGARLQGQLQELRLWSSSLQDSPFNNHTKAPAAYDGNTDAYDELVFRLPLTQKTDHTTAVTMSGVEPNLSGISASFASWTNAEPYDSIEETYYYDGISLAAGTFDDNKIRLEDNELVGALDVKTRAERSQYDRAALDSKKLGVYYSPQTMINEDIIAQLGFTELDSYIGDPGQTRESSYPDLIRVAQDYWKKYETKNDMNAFISIFTLFDLSFFQQLHQLLPARADKITGLLIQPNVLERNKDFVLPAVERRDLTNDAVFDVQETTHVTASYPVYLAEVQEQIATITGNDDDQLQMLLTASAQSKYGGTTYSYDYVFWDSQNAEYVTGSTPYWMSDALLPSITSSTPSTYWQTEGISYYSASTQQTFATPTSSWNNVWDGVNATEGYGDTIDYVGAGTVVKGEIDAITTFDAEWIVSGNERAGRVAVTTTQSIFEWSVDTTAGLSASMAVAGINITGIYLKGEIKVTPYSQDAITGFASSTIAVSTSSTDYTNLLTASLEYPQVPGNGTVTFQTELINNTWEELGIPQDVVPDIIGGGQNLYFIFSFFLNTNGMDYTVPAPNDVVEIVLDFASINAEIGFTGVSTLNLNTLIIPYSVAEIQDFIGTGAENSFYNGSKMTSANFNVASNDTIDGGPVVESREANPNQLIYQNQNQSQGSFVISGQ